MPGPGPLGGGGGRRGDITGAGGGGGNHGQGGAGRRRLPVRERQGNEEIRKFLNFYKRRNHG